MKRILITLAMALGLTPTAYAQTYLKGGSLIESTTTITAASGTTTLTKASSTVQIISGTAMQTIVLPSATTLSVGQSFKFYSKTTNIVTIQSNGGAIQKLLSPNEKSEFRLTGNGTAAGVWAVENNAAVNVLEPTFAAKVTTGPSFAVTEKSSNWITATSSGGTGSMVIGFPAGTFTVAPACTCSPALSTSAICAVGAITSTSATVNTYSNTGTAANESGVSLICRKNGTDSFQQAIRMDQSDTDWQSYTPATQGLGTISAASFLWRRDGDSIEISGRFVVGANPAVELQIGLPSGLLTADTTKIPSTRLVGTFTRNLNTAYTTGGVLAQASVSYINWGYFFAGGTAVGVGQLVPQTGQSVTGSGDTFSFTAKVPIQGWTRNQSAPLISGGVTSSSLGLEKVERARVALTSSSVCTVDNSSGSWITSTTPNAGGDCTINITGFSAAPRCTVSPADTPNPVTSFLVSAAIYSSSQTTVRLVSQYIASGSASIVAFNSFVNVICVGPR